MIATIRFSEPLGRDLGFEPSFEQRLVEPVDQLPDHLKDPLLVVRQDERRRSLVQLVPAALDRRELPEVERGVGLARSVLRPVDLRLDRKSTRLNSSHVRLSRMPSSA